MESYNKEYYLENRKKKRFSEKIFVFTSGVTCKIPELIEHLKEFETKLSDKEDVDVWIDPARYDQDDYDSYLMVSWTDWETEADFERRMWEKKWAKERAIDSLERLIGSNKEEAVEIIKKLGLI